MTAELIHILQEVRAGRAAYWLAKTVRGCDARNESWQAGNLHRGGRV